MKLNPRDLRIDIFSNSVAGAISYFKITHLPTGYTASCDNECETHGDKKRVLDAERKKCAANKLTTLMDGRDD